MQRRERICVTGMAGIIGRVVHAHLCERYQVRALIHRSPVAGVENLAADITDVEALRAALEGQDILLHMAAYTGMDENWSALLPANVIGTYCALEAAARAGVKRVVFTSSLAVVAGHLDAIMEYLREPRSAEQKMAFLDSLPAHGAAELYGASKVWGETLCGAYHRTRGISCVCLRLGEVTPDDRPNASDPAGPLKWCSHARLIRSLDRALEATLAPTFEVRSVISAAESD